MGTRKTKAFKALASFIIIAFANVSAQVGPARSGDALLPPGVASLPPGAHLITARLKTTYRQPITVNGKRTSSGATIFTGSIIETPDCVGATITLVDTANTGVSVNVELVGVLEMTLKAKTRLDFDQSRNVKVTLLKGCMVLTTQPDATGEVDTEKVIGGKTEKVIAGKSDQVIAEKTGGVLAGKTDNVITVIAGKTDKTGGVLNFCLKDNEPKPDTAKNAGAKRERRKALRCEPLALFWFGGAPTLAVTRGHNPSPSTP